MCWPPRRVFHIVGVENGGEGGYVVGGTIAGGGYRRGGVEVGAVVVAAVVLHKPMNSCSLYTSLS